MVRYTLLSVVSRLPLLPSTIDAGTVRGNNVCHVVPCSEDFVLFVMMIIIITLFAHTVGCPDCRVRMHDGIVMTGTIKNLAQ